MLRNRLALALLVATGCSNTPSSSPGVWHDGYEHRLVVKLLDGKFDLPAEADGLDLVPMIRLPDKKADAIDRNLRGLFTSPPTADRDAAIDAASKLAGIDTVLYVYLEPIDIEDPADIAPTTPGFDAQQTYRSPLGVDAAFATLVGANGAGVRLLDVESAWDYAHEDLVGLDMHPEPNQTIASDFIAEQRFHHGSAVIGVTSSLDNGYGMTGLVRGAEVYTFPQKTNEAGWRRVDAVAAAIAAARPGDVVLLEMQTFGADGNYGPAEYEQAVWSVVKAGTDRGVIVVAAAGNGAEDLDGPGYAEYRARGDSGAIIVGAASHEGERLDFSTFGARVDVHGWGENVATLGYGELATVGDDVHQAYTARFAGTSSASPIVASAAVAIQSFAIARLGRSLAPDEMRQLLVSTGTPQLPSVAGKIGPRPNIRAAIEKLAPAMELVCTDTEDDDGDGMIDCADADCAATAACARPVRTYAAAPARAIPDNDPIGTTSRIRITDTGTVTSVKVTIGITHPTASDLVVTVRHGGVTMDVVRNTGGTSSNINATFAITGLGSDLAGDWFLQVADTVSGETGTLDSWKLDLEVAP